MALACPGLALRLLALLVEVVAVEVFFVVASLGCALLLPLWLCSEADFSLLEKCKLEGHGVTRLTRAEHLQKRVVKGRKGRAIPRHPCNP